MPAPTFEASQTAHPATGSVVDFPCPPGTTWPLEEVKQTGTLVPSPLGIGLRAERGQLRGLSVVGTEHSVAGTSHWPAGAMGMPVLGAEWPWEVTSASDSQFALWQSQDAASDHCL